VGVGRLAIDASAARTGGGVSRLGELGLTLSHLASENEYLLVVRQSVAQDLASLPPKTQILSVPSALSLTILRVCWEQLYLPRLLHRFDPDWILSPFNILPLGAGRGSGARKAVIISNIAPFIPELRRSASAYQSARLHAIRVLTYRSIRAADVIFLLSSTAHELLEHLLTGKQVAFLPMAPPSPTLIDASRKVRLPESSPFFLLVGDLLAHKGIEDAIRAASILLDRGEQVRVIICGNPVNAPYATQLQELRRTLRAENVSFLGTRSHPEVMALMRASQGLLACSRVENTSRVPIEAMAVGAPVIAADVPGSREACGDAAAYYPPGNHAELAHLMSEVLADSSKAEELRKRGQRRISSTDWLSATRRILETLELL
jgi:glycosyltransferase involved in cell wall biosynthesis